MTEKAKKLVDALRNSYGYSERRDADAADLIESLSDKLEQVTRERDAALRSLKRGFRACSACRYGDDTPENNEVCGKCRPNPEGYSEWKWEGVEMEG